MKKPPTENIRIKIIFISLAILTSFLLAINFIPIFVANAGITTKFTGNLDSDREAYVNQSNPDMNYFDSLWGNAVIGNSCETFVHFNLELLPEETEELYFIIESYYLGPKYWFSLEDVEMNLILVESNWSSIEITWNNKPKHGEIIDTVNASEIKQPFTIEYYDLEKTINLTKIFKKRQANEISFCINITENNKDLNDSVYLNRIQLIWNYEKLLISYTTIISSVIIFSLLIGTVYYLRKDLYYCPECNTRRSLTEKFCSSCGTNFKDDIMTKGSDYQIILIFLWIFALFEVGFLILILVINFFFLIGPYLITLLLVPWVILCFLQIRNKIKKYREIKPK